MGWDPGLNKKEIASLEHTFISIYFLTKDQCDQPATRPFLTGWTVYTLGL